ncbi:MAG: sulfotransferase [Caulobacteraceae bacterium]
MKAPRAGSPDLDALLDRAAAHYAAGRLAEAERVYREAERAEPRDFRARYSLAVIDLRQGRFEPARARLADVTRRQPAHFAAWHNLGVALEALRHWRRARAAYAQALALQPDAADTAFCLAAVDAVEGHVDEAIALYRRLAQAPESRARALSRLAVLRPAAVTDDELAWLRAAVEAPEANAALHYALGAALEARGEYDAAFAQFSAGAALRGRALAAAGKDPVVLEREHEASARRVRELFTAQFIARQKPGDSRAAPIFIVGFPRCGSSLLEQILASHSDVQGLGETGAFGEVADAWFAALPNSDASASRRLAEGYLAALRAAGWRSGARPVDKTLENYLHLGLIALAFPRAVIVHCLRGPADTCLACFAELFASGNETLDDLAQIGREYRRYRQVMDHWREVLPGRVREVSYEALVASPEVQIRALVSEICGLPWAPACLDFHQTRRPVTTASVEQVRRPIYASSVGRWRRYQAHLDPLFDALGPYAPRG